MNTLRTLRERIQNGLLIMQRPPTKYVANIPQTPTKHSVRRRGRFIAPVSLHNQIHISISPHTCFHIIEYIHKFHRKRAFVPHFVGTFIFAGTINRSPTAACGLPLRCKRIAKTLLTDCQNVANRLLKQFKRITKTIQTDCDNIANGLR